MTDALVRLAEAAADGGRGRASWSGSPTGTSPAPRELGACEGTSRRSRRSAGRAVGDRSRRSPPRGVATAEQRDAVLACGERLSLALACAALAAAGLDPAPWDTRRLVVTDSAFGEAAVDAAATNERVAAAWRCAAARRDPGRDRVHRRRPRRPHHDARARRLRLHREPARRRARRRRRRDLDRRRRRALGAAGRQRPADTPCRASPTTRRRSSPATAARCSTPRRWRRPPGRHPDPRPQHLQPGGTAHAGLEPAHGRGRRRRHGRRRRRARRGDRHRARAADARRAATRSTRPASRCWPPSAPARRTRWPCRCRRPTRHARSPCSTARSSPPARRRRGTRRGREVTDDRQPT